jgi:hypothetical protein
VPAIAEASASENGSRRAFGWIKTIGGLGKSRFVGRAKTDFAFTFAAAAYNLVRPPKLLEAA